MEYNFSEKLVFPKSNSSEKVDAAQKYLVRKNTSSENVFILNSFSTKKGRYSQKYLPQNTIYFQELVAR